MPEFNVQRARYDVPSGGGTQSIDPVTSLSSAVELNGNNRRNTAGSISLTSNLEIDDMSIGMYLSDLGTLTYTRPSSGTTFSMRSDVEVLEYQGVSGGPNEFVTRGRYSKTILTGVNSGAVTISGVVSINKCIPIITAISCDDTTDGGARATAYITVDSTTQATVNVGGNTSRVTVYFSIVEFTGSAWSVGHGGVISNADTGSISLVRESDGIATGTSFDVTDWATACIFGQHRGDAASDANQAIADNWPTFKPNALTTKVDWSFHPNHDAASNQHFVHVLKHADMTVQRMTDTQNVQGAMNVAVPAPVGDMAQAFVLVSRRSSGTGTAYGRGWVNARLTSTGNVELWCHRSGNTISTELQVIDLSGILAAVAARRIFIA